MPSRVEVDGSFFTFPDGWEFQKIDEWPEQRSLAKSPFNSKGCDLVAFHDSIVWLIEAKDYTYPGAAVPEDLEQVVAVKAFHSLAILHAVARWGERERMRFSRKVLGCSEMILCLSIEIPHGGRRLMGVQTPLAGILDRLKKATRPLRVYRPIVSNSFQPNGVPWTVERDPGARLIHVDR